MIVRLANVLTRDPKDSMAYVAGTPTTGWSQTHLDGNF
jgi:hypothetical protein